MRPGKITASSVNQIPRTGERARRYNTPMRWCALQWIDSGVDLRAGDSLQFTSTGTLNRANSKTTGPDGAPRARRLFLSVNKSTNHSPDGSFHVTVSFATGATVHSDGPVLIIHLIPPAARTP